MKRKLFSTILFGALLVASTSGLTSCKDYDDDISNLQSQIDKLATADQLSAKVSELQAAIAAAQSAAEAKAAAAQTVADAAKAAAADAAAAAAKAQSTADGATQAAKDAAAAAAAANEVAKAAQVAVDKLAAEGHATKAELEAAAKAAQEYVDSVKKAIEDAHAADKAAIEKAIADSKNELLAEIKKNAEAIDALDKELNGEGGIAERLAAAEKAIEEGANIDLTELTELLEEFEAKAKEILGTAFVMVTDVDLYVGTANELVDTDLDFWQVKELADITFPGNKETGEDTFTFTKDNVRLFDDKLIVRVSPVDATLTPEMISLINSQGAEVSKDIVEITSVEPYEELLTRGASNNGLWVVNFKVVDNKQDELKALAWTKKNNNDVQILYAVAVNNTQDVTDSRRVVSAYDVTMDSSKPNRSVYTDLKVNNTSISNIHNRITTGEEGGTVDAKEYIWKDLTKPAVAATKDNTVTGDNRQAKPVLPVAVGENIKIAFTGLNKPIRGFYVTLDSDRAVESAPSEINAWNSYKYVNVGKAGEAATLQEGNTGYIQVADLAAMSLVGDVIGFRVFAINLDGTLVDPDGIAFYVGIKPAAAVDEVALAPATAKVKYPTPTAVSKTSAQNATEAIDLTEAFKGVTFSDIDWTVADVKGYNNLNSVTLASSDFAVTYFKANGDPTTTVTEAASMKIQIVNPQNFIDDTEYTFTGMMKNTVSSGAATGTYDVRKLTVKVTKAMPWGEVPVNVTYNALQNKNLMLTAAAYNGVTLGRVGNKVVNVAAKDGEVDLKKFLVYDNANNDKIGSSSEYNKYSYKVLNSAWWFNTNVTPNKWQNDGATAFDASGNYIEDIAAYYNTTNPAGFVDCKTEHAIKAYYTYGAISHKLNANKTAYISTTFDAEADQTPTVVFMSWSYQDAAYTTWKTKNYKKYNSSTKAWDRINLNQVQWQADANVGNAFNITDLQIWAVFGLKSQVAGLGANVPASGSVSTAYNGKDLATLFTNSNLKVLEAYTMASGIKNAYFEPVVTGGAISQFKQISKREGAADHTEQLVIKVVDCFNYVSTITVDFAVVTTPNVTTTGYLDCTGE